MVVFDALSVTVYDRMVGVTTVSVAVCDGIE
jgi:hypothetical protein